MFIVLGQSVGGLGLRVMSVVCVVRDGASRNDNYCKI